MTFVDKLKNKMQKQIQDKVQEQANQNQVSIKDQYKAFLNNKLSSMGIKTNQVSTSQPTTNQSRQTSSYFSNTTREFTRQKFAEIKETATPTRLEQFKKEQEEKRKQQEAERKQRELQAKLGNVAEGKAEQIDTNKIAEVKNGRVEFRDKNLIDKAKEQYKYMQLTPTNLNIASKEISTMGDIVGNASISFFTGIPKAIGHLEENAERKIGKDLMQKARRGGDVYQWLEQHPEQQSKLSQEEIEGFKQISDYKKSIEDTSKYFTNLGENGGKITQLNDWAGISAVKENAQKQIMASQQELITPFGKKMGDLLPSTVDSSLGMAFSMINPVLRIIFV